MSAFLSFRQTMLVIKHSSVLTSMHKDLSPQEFSGTDELARLWLSHLRCECSFLSEHPAVRASCATVPFLRTPLSLLTCLVKASALGVGCSAYEPLVPSSGSRRVGALVVSEHPMRSNSKWAWLLLFPCASSARFFLSTLTFLLLL